MENQETSTFSENDSSQKKGTLTIVGCGLHPGQMTIEAKSHIENADRVLVVAPNALSIQQIRQLNDNIENLGRFYGDDRTRRQTYRAMALRMIEVVKEGLNVCTVFYGHPGIFVLSTHKAQHALESQGYQVRMLPGISADAALYADLNIDPATSGSQAYEATQFLLTHRVVDTAAALILWQIGLVGEHTLKVQSPGKKGLEAITRLLLEKYPRDHRVCVYEAATLPGFEARKEWVELNQLPEVKTQSISTLFVPPATELEFASERLEWLGLKDEDLAAWDEPVDEEVLI